MFEKDIVISPFLPEHIFLSVPEGNSLENRGSIAVSDILAQPFLYPEIGGYFLRAFERKVNSLTVRLLLTTS